MSKEQDEARLTSETETGGREFDVAAWRALPFFQKIGSADKPLKWLLVMPAMSGLYGCLFLTLISSAVDYPITVPVGAFLFQDAFMLAELTIMVLGVLLAIACNVFLYRFIGAGVALAYAGFVAYGIGNLLFLGYALIQGSFISWGLLVNLLSGVVFYGNAIYFRERKHLFTHIRVG